MAAQRYSRILESARYYSQIDNYIKYITDSTKRGARVGTGEKRPPTKVLYVDPFGMDLPPGVLAKVSASADAWNTYDSKFAGFTDHLLPVDTTPLKLEGFRAARVIIVTGVSQTGTVKTSAVTGAKYKSYGGKSTSIPFGQKPSFINQTDAFNQIKTQLNLTGSTVRITLQPEKI